MIDAELQRVEAALDALLADNDPSTQSYEEFRGHQFDQGLAWVMYPEGHGGLGVSWELPLVDFVLAGHVMGIADGPSEVHKATVARQVLGRSPPWDTPASEGLVREVYRGERRGGRGLLPAEPAPAQARGPCEVPARPRRRRRRREVGHVRLRALRGDELPVTR